MKIRSLILHDHERGVLIRDGRAVRWLEPGKHWLWKESTAVTKIDLDRGFTKLTPELARVLPEGVADVVEVPESHLGLVRLDGRAHAVLVAGRWALFRERARVTAEVVSMDPIFARALPATFVALARDHVGEIAVEPWERSLLVVDAEPRELLGPGRHFVFREHRKVEHRLVDMRERELTITGQEVMTADKATLRVTVVVRFRVVDAMRALTVVEKLESALHTEAQLVTRRWIGGHGLDTLLERRHDAARDMRASLAESAAGWGVEIAAADLKDLVLPGEMRAILNQVLEAEKRAAANVILRREETAATRSLANTAKLLAESPTLMRLKELEAWKEIAERVGHVTVVAAPNDLGRVLALPAPASK